MATGKTVLICDDDEGVRLFVRAVMEGAGWRCLEARNGVEGFDMAMEHTPDLLLLDVDMPLQNGFETYVQLRGSHFTEGIPIVMLTGVNQSGNGASYTKEDLEAAFEVPAPEGFIDKPVDSQMLLDCVMGVIG